MVKFTFENKLSEPVCLDCIHYYKDEVIGESKFGLKPGNAFTFYLPPQDTEEISFRVTLQKDKNIKFSESTETPKTVIMSLKKRDIPDTYEIVEADI